MRRRDLTLGLLLATAVGTVRAQVPTKQHRIAIITTQPVANIDDPTIPVFRAFFEELRRLGDVEGSNLAIERYSGGGRPAVYPDLAPRGRRPQPGRDRRHRQSDHSCGPRGHRHNTDCLDRA